MAGDVKTTRPQAGDLRQAQVELTRQRVLEAARRLLVSGGYSQVTMQELAVEAGVAYQTLFKRFGNKVRLAMEVIDTGFPHVAPTLAWLEAVSEAGDPVAWLRSMGPFSRRINEPCADLFRFMRESGDPTLLGRFKATEKHRRGTLAKLGPQLERSGLLRPGISGSQAADIVWAMAGSEVYAKLVLDQGWTPESFESWLCEALVSALLVTTPD
jgi:TetR/AcrR family transcriptional regulator, regulator of autoinduction and epiphytic fitness